MQFPGGYVFGSHLAEIALDQRPRLRDILRIPAVSDGAFRSALRRPKAGINGVYIASKFPQVVVQAGGVKAAAQT